MRQSMNGIPYCTNYEKVSKQISKLVLPPVCNYIKNEGHGLSWLIFRMERFPFHRMFPFCLYKSVGLLIPAPTSKVHSATEIVAPGDRGTSSSNPELLLRIHQCCKQRLRNRANPFLK